MTRCKKGKACGDTCISKGLMCRAQLKPSLGEGLSSIGGKIEGLEDLFLNAFARKNSPVKNKEAVIIDIAGILRGGGLTQEPSATTKVAPVAKPQVKSVTKPPNKPLLPGHSAVTQLHDSKLEREKLERVGDPLFNKWGESSGPNSKLLGSGDFGIVTLSPSLDAVKRGEFSSSEPRILEKVGRSDLGPRLIAADLDGPGVQKELGYEFRTGRMATSVIQGDPLGDKSPTSEVGGVKVAEAFWKARAALHRLGVAHNDMHNDNVFIDEKGKARFLDFGLSQDSSKAALAEALGVFGEGEKVAPGASGEGDWQVRRWSATAGQEVMDSLSSSTTRERLRRKLPALYQVSTNYSKVYEQLRSMGFSDTDINYIQDHGIRSPLSTYETGVWSRLSETQAQKLINTLYEGL